MSDFYSYPDYEAYDLVWGIIQEIIELDYQAKYVVDIKKDAKKIIWDNYCYFNRQSKIGYMNNPLGVLDRHKVCACYMFAIIRSDVLTCEFIPDGDNASVFLLNEKLAITIGMTLLRSLFIKEAKVRVADVKKREELIGLIENGIAMPQKCNHGRYESNFVVELYYTKMENNYNILALANELYLLECLTVGETDAIPIK